MKRFPITKWYRIVDKKKDFNHFEYNHVSGEYPLPIYGGSLQEAWKNNKWFKKHGYQYESKHGIITGGWHEYIWYLITWELIKWGKIRAKFVSIF